MEPTDDNLLYEPIHRIKKRVRDLISFYEDNYFSQTKHEKSNEQEARPIPTVDECIEPARKKKKRFDDLENNSTPKRVSKSKKQKSDNAASAKRLLIIHEIISTEKAYTQNLSLVQKEIITPLRNILTINEIQKIFSNISIIHSINETLFKQLETRMKNFNPKKSTIGDIFINIIPFLGVYCDYCCNYESAIQISQQLKRENEQYANFYNNISSNCNGYGLTDLLIMPVQRVPRYKLLLEKLIAYTQESHPDYELLTKALSLVSDKVSDINRKMNLVNQQRIMTQLHSKFQPTYNLPGGLVQPWRHYISHQKMKWLPSLRENALNIIFFIFNDIFILANPLSEEKYECITAQPIWDSYIKKLDDDWVLAEYEKYAFQIVNSRSTWTIIPDSLESFEKLKTQFELAKEDYISQYSDKKLKNKNIKLIKNNDKQEWMAIDPDSFQFYKDKQEDKISSPMAKPVKSKSSESFVRNTKTPKKERLSLVKDLQYSTISPKRSSKKDKSMTLRFSKTQEDSENIDNKRYSETLRLNKNKSADKKLLQSLQEIKSTSANNTPSKKRKSRGTPLKLRI